MPMQSLLRALRLISGLVLMTFVIGHLSNLALGLVSLDTMETWRIELIGPWQTPLGKGLLVSSMLLHLALGLYAIAMRRSMAMSRTDIVQLILGLCTPPLLAAHVVVMGTANRLAPEFEPSYSQILTVYWHLAPTLAFQQLFAVVFVWVHGAIGLYTWLVLKPWWRRIAGAVVPLLFAVPIAALLGFAEAGKEVLDKLKTDAAWRSDVLAMIDRLTPIRSELDALQSRLLTVYAILLAIALLVFALRRLSGHFSRVRVDYDEGHQAIGARGMSILDLSRVNGVPHADVCSARGRCGTCRVEVTAGAEQLSPLNEIEQSTLARVGAGANVRLACQARVLGTGVHVVRLLPAYADATAAHDAEAWLPAPESPTQVRP